MSEIQKNYDPKLLEQKCYETWEKKGLFRCGQTKGVPFTIMLPPPNVTGTLHMGHGFQQTLMDLLIRYHRMMGDNALWQPGTDHAGIATQMVVERNLNAEGVSRHDLGREKFIERIWQWKEYSGGTIAKQMRRLGASCDWSRERFTMDDGLSKAVQTCFIKLYEDGLAYRGERLVNWDPVLLTAVSDLEVVQEEENGSLWHFRYPLVDDSGSIEIATTRPETMLGDVAVAVNPEDERYKHLIGKLVKLPLTEREIPIIADEYVDVEFGTGCVKITPAHDFNDYEIGKRHHLPIINILANDAKLNTNVPKVYQGLDRFEARKKIVIDMEAQGFLVKVEPHVLKVPKGDRTGAILEPYLTKQWFVKAGELGKPALEAVENGSVRFVPDNWKNTYYSWMNDLQDWCISRQLWWGHRIPAWYDLNGKVYVGSSEEDVRTKYGLSLELILQQDEDVFDTWFSAALWPFSTLGWPENTPELKKYYPTSVLVTGFDIIFFWVARMMMFGLYFMKDVPFRDIYITGLIRDAEGQKMSKSKGNVLDPVDLIDGISLEDLISKRTQALMQPQMKTKVEKQTHKHFPNGIEAYGTDALRFTFTALASTSRDICFDVARMEGYRNFCNKLWNASRFVMMNLEDYDANDNQYKIGIAEHWIWHKLNQTIVEVHKHIAQYRFDLLAQTIYEFVWNQYCDWYVEFAKASLNDENVTPEQKQGVQYTLITVLDKILRLAHPIIPFITEEIFSQVKVFTLDSITSIMTSNFPVFDQNLVNEKASNEIEWVKRIIVAIRTIRSEMNVKPSLNILLYIKNATTDELVKLQVMKSLIQSMAKVSDIIVNNDVPMSATTLVDNMELHIPLAGLIDVTAEQMRLKKEQEKLEKEIIRLRAKLSNEKFVANAPLDVVEKEKTKLFEYQSTQAKLVKQFEKLEALLP
ncbi:valine--tRNA ligase [Fastidiosibacter lacustris]|uniref:valine--tRNA ligase n=1 Tax=Fastidiosibacter lacustris TaxID=2056695 RepID=UPI000E34B12C|nr:valine--tRNA ligase [Fastidiosibacter lacustris]